MLLREEERLQPLIYTFERWKGRSAAARKKKWGKKDGNIRKKLLEGGKQEKRTN